MFLRWVDFSEIGRCFLRKVDCFIWVDPAGMGRLRSTGSYVLLALLSYLIIQSLREGSYFQVALLNYLVNVYS